MNDAEKSELWPTMIGWNELPGIVEFHMAQAVYRSKRDREESLGFKLEVARAVRWRRVCALIQEAERLRLAGSIEFEKALMQLCDLKRGKWPVRPEDYKQAGTATREVFSERACGYGVFLEQSPPSKATVLAALRCAFSQSYSQNDGQGRRNHTL